MALFRRRSSAQRATNQQRRTPPKPTKRTYLHTTQRKKVSSIVRAGKARVRTVLLASGIALAVSIPLLYKFRKSSIERGIPVEEQNERVYDVRYSGFDIEYPTPERYIQAPLKELPVCYFFLALNDQNREALVGKMLEISMSKVSQPVSNQSDADTLMKLSLAGLRHWCSVNPAILKREISLADWNEIQELLEQADEPTIRKNISVAINAKQKK